MFEKSLSKPALFRAVITKKYVFAARSPTR
jgi:hypothetical protein